INFPAWWGSHCVFGVFTVRNSLLRQCKSRELLWPELKLGVFYAKKAEMEWIKSKKCPLGPIY
ncbi:hypothetical protein, partial [Photobacterium sanctipauli]|uniref:hypothetical protein n=1 Tax=Photobacterium sanctipauli TaxID=1342794 RepID=UPI001C1E3801